MRRALRHTWAQWEATRPGICGQGRVVKALICPGDGRVNLACDTAGTAADHRATVGDMCRGVDGREGRAGGWGARAARCGVISTNEKLTHKHILHEHRVVAQREFV